MDPVITKILEGTPYAGMGSTLERNALIGVIRNLINESKYTVEYIISYCESVGYQRQMAEDIFKELTGLSPKLIINNNEYYNGPSYLPPYSIAWGYSKTKPNTVNLIVPFEYGYAVMEKDEVNAPIPTVISATIPEAFDELKKVAKGIQTLDKIITKKLLEAEDVQTDAHTVHQVNLPYAASPLQILKKNFKDKVISVSEFERQASKLLASEEITVDEAEDLMTWKQDLIDEDESYANEVLQLNENWKPLDAEDVDEDLESFDYTYSLLVNGNIDLYKERLNKMSKVELMDYIAWAEEMGIGREKLKLNYITASKKVKSNIKKDSNFEKALSYVEERISNDNNNENDSYPLAFEEAENLFGVDADKLQEECDRRTMTWRNASKKVTAKNLVDNKFYLEMNNLDEEQDSELLNTLQKFYDIAGFVPPLWDKDIDWYLLSHNLQIAYEKNGGSISNFKGYTSADNKLLTKELLQSLYPNNSNELINLLSDIEDMTPSGKVLRKYDDLDNIRFKSRASKKVTAENMTLDDIEAEDNKDQVQEEIEKIDETPAEDIFSESTPEQYFDKALQEDKVDTINDVVSKCIDKFSEKFKDFDKYQVKILSYNTKVLEDDKPVQEEMVEDKELNANAILQVILQITNNAEEENIKKVLAVFSITNGELHWTGTVRGENDQVVAFTEEGLDALFEVEEPSEEELEDII